MKNHSDPQCLAQGEENHPIVTVGQLVALLLTFPQDQEIVLYPKDHTPIEKYQHKRVRLEGIYQAESGGHHYVSIRF